MRRAFFLFLIVFIAVASAGYLLWLIGQALYDLWRDRKLYREMEELERWAQQQRNVAESEQAGASPPPEP